MKDNFFIVNSENQKLLVEEFTFETKIVQNVRCWKVSLFKK